MISIICACGLLRELGRENPQKGEEKRPCVIFQALSVCISSLREEHIFTPHRGHNVSERSRNLDMKPALEKTLFCSRLTWAGPDGLPAVDLGC